MLSRRLLVAPAIRHRGVGEIAQVTVTEFALGRRLRGVFTSLLLGTSCPDPKS